MVNRDQEMRPVRSPVGWVHPDLCAEGEVVSEGAPGRAWRRRSQRIERTSTRWQVTTLASCYRLDLLEATFVRTERQGAERVAVDLGLVPHHRLPRDGAPVRLWAVLDCRLGEPMVLLIDLVGDDQPGTFRVTTAVVAIRPDPGRGESPT